MIEFAKQKHEAGIFIQVLRAFYHPPKNNYLKR